MAWTKMGEKPSLMPWLTGPQIFKLAPAGGRSAGIAGLIHVLI